MSMSESNYGGQDDSIEALYAKPYKVYPKRRAPSIVSGQSDGIYDRLDRKGSVNKSNNSVRDRADPDQSEEASVESIQRKISTRSDIAYASEQNENQHGENKLDEPDDYDEVASEMSAPRSMTSQSLLSVNSQDNRDELKQYQVDILERKDTNELVKELRKLGLEDESDRLILALRHRFELESTFIDACSNDGVVIVEGDHGDVSNEHKSIGGLRVKALKPKFANYDEYDPEIIKKYGHFAQGFSREKMASDAADLRRRAANMLWAVENMERMIDPNSRVRYVRQENEQ